MVTVGELARLTGEAKATGRPKKKSRRDFMTGRCGGSEARVTRMLLESWFVGALKQATS